MATYRGQGSLVVLLERCRSLRRSNTDAEALLWHLVRARQVGGVKFRRQHEYGPDILDFYCHERGLAIELDSDQHALPDHGARDAIRSQFLEANGIRVLRFSNAEVLQETESVLLKIWGEVVEPSP